MLKFINPLKIDDRFDETTKFRLRNSFFVAISLTILDPIIISLQGLYLGATLIAVFMIANMLAVKTNKLITDNFDASALLHGAVIFHLLYTIGAGIYFVNAELFVYVVIILEIIAIALFSAYSIHLDHHISNHTPELMKDFRINANSNYANASMIGLGSSALLSWFNPDYAIISFIVFDAAFFLYLLENINFHNKQAV